MHFIIHTPKASSGGEGKRSAPGDARASPLEGASEARQKRRRGKWQLAQSRGKRSAAEEKKGQVATCPKQGQAKRGSKGEWKLARI
ncbi:MAG: hypothetical protein CL920_24005 [Deltaproteobacteria bacterium]|nr:hypothetical protein [Deltaproteobacteria bacterium]